MIERYFYNADNREILTSNGKPFLDRIMGAGELAHVPKKKLFLMVVSNHQKTRW